MRRYIVTCGTSFGTSLCWGLTDELKEVLPSLEQHDPRTGGLRREIADRIKKPGSGSGALAERASVIADSLIAGLDGRFYPAEIATLMDMFDPGKKPGGFGPEEGDEMHFLYSDSEDGEFSARVLMRCVDMIWPGRFTCHLQGMKFLTIKDGDKQITGYENMRSCINHYLQTNPPVFVVTGGFKLMSMAVASVAALRPVHYSCCIVYKFEGGGLVVWDFDDHGEDSIEIFM